MTDKDTLIEKLCRQLVEKYIFEKNTEDVRYNIAKDIRKFENEHNLFIHYKYTNNKTQLVVEYGGKNYDVF